MSTIVKTQVPKFFQDVQTRSDFKRLESAKKHGIKSVLYIPIDSGVIELGTTKEFRIREGSTVNDICRKLRMKGMMGTIWEDLEQMPNDLFSGFDFDV